MSVMKFYRVNGGELLTLRVEINQTISTVVDRHGYPDRRVRGKSRADACKLARSGGFYRTKAEALRAAFPLVACSPELRA